MRLRISRHAPPSLLPRLRWLLVAAVVGVGWAFACALPRYNADLESVPEGSVPADAGLESASDAWSADEDGAAVETSDTAPGCLPCGEQLGTVPCRLVTDAAAGDPNGHLYFTTRSMRLGWALDAGPDDWKSIGLNLDCLDTESLDAQLPCIPREAGIVLAATQLDGVQGIDNSLAWISTRRNLPN